MMKTIDLLKILRNQSGCYVSGEEIALHLKVSRTAVWKQIHQLEKNGYTIEAIPHLGYRLVAAPDRLLPDEIQNGLKTKQFGKKLFCYQETTSTNDRALELAVARVPEGTVVTSESQSKGRGRRERVWLSKPETNLLFSVIFRPPWIAEQGALITLLVAAAVAGSIREETGLEAYIKWPNDILIQETKVAGILTEMQAQADRIEYLVCGVGINVNSVPVGNLRCPATSLAKLNGNGIARIPLLKRILEEIEELYTESLKNGIACILKVWEEYSCMNGIQVMVEQPSGEKCEGMVMGIDENGALLLRLENGVPKKITSGEVSRVRTKSGFFTTMEKGG